jgi:cytochrome o ubiquinol oxidase subunit 3
MSRPLTSAEIDSIAFYDPHEHEHAGGGSTMLGFWIYLLSDCFIFAVLFAMYGVLGTSYAGGPQPLEVFDLRLVALNTAILLLSSITYGFAILEAQQQRVAGTQAWFAITVLLGLTFVGVELFEFAHMIGEGAGPQRSAFLSSFFALVGTHGLHVSVGIVWLVTLMVQTGKHGLIPANHRRLACLSLFWHFLDVIWIGVFTFAYLLSTLR